jgi:hypothetical protein
MNIFPVVSPELLMISTLVVGILLLLALVAMAFMYNYFHNLMNQQNETIQIIQEDIAAMCQGAVGVGEHLARLEQRTTALSKRQDQVEMQEAPERSYTRAIKMVRNGANIDQIISDCGLARGEAELLLLTRNIDSIN